MKTRTRAEHVHPGVGGDAVASVTIQPPGRNTPQVNVMAYDNGRGIGGIHVQGYLTIEAAELLRRALNDVLGPIHEAAEQNRKAERLRDLFRELIPDKD